MSHNDLYGVREMDDSDLHLIDFTRKLEEGSLNAFENAAKQLLTLITGLLGLFFGILALKDTPHFLRFLEVKFLGIGAVGFYFGALFLP